MSCQECGADLSRDEAWFLGDNVYCEDCFDSCCSYCHVCDEPYLLEDLVRFDGHYYCKNCKSELNFDIHKKNLLTQAL